MNPSGRDPYLGLLNELRADTDERSQSYICIGKIIAISQTKILVQADGQELDEQDIYINPAMAPGYKEKGIFTTESGHLSGPYTLSGLATCPNGLHTEFTFSGMTSGKSVEDGVYEPKERLMPGDYVILIPSMDRQIYYLLCKVVPYGSLSTDQSPND